MDNLLDLLIITAKDIQLAFLQKMLEIEIFLFRNFINFVSFILILYGLSGIYLFWNIFGQEYFSPFQIFYLISLVLLYLAIIIFVLINYWKNREWNNLSKKERERINKEIEAEIKRLRRENEELEDQINRP